MNIIEFLKARLDEEEALADRCLTDRVCTWSGEDWAEIGRPSLDLVRTFDPHRVLREVEAKRAIVDLAWHHLGDEDYGWGMEEAKRQVLVLMAQVYSDHPDYDPAWA